MQKHNLETESSTISTDPNITIISAPAGVTLADLKPGECGTIVRLLGNSQGRLRLLEMGLTPGTHVKVVRAAAFGGPLDIEVRAYKLSLRREEASSVWLGIADI